MRKRLTAAAIAGTLGLAGLTGFAVAGNTVLASAATADPSAAATDGTATPEGTATSEGTATDESRPDPVTRILEALKGLVSDGTITQDQAQKVADTLATELPGRGGGPDGDGGRGGPDGHGGGFGVDVDATVATALGLTEDEVDTALHAGTTVAELAEAEGVETDAVVAALVEAAQTKLDEAVAAGELEQARADEISAGLEERFTTLVEEGFKGGRGFGGPGRDGGSDGATDDSATDDSATSDSTTSEGTTENSGLTIDS